MELKIGNVKSVIEYLTRVKQGDVLAPTLFLFPMQAVAECIIDTWKEHDIKPFTYLFDCSGTHGQLARHKLPKRNVLSSPSITAAELILMLYVDNGALCFGLHNDMTRGTSLAEIQMRRFGLIVHVGCPNERSKTEFVFFPAVTTTRTIIHDYITKSALQNGSTNVITDSQEKILTETQKHAILVKSYNDSPQAQPFTTTSGGEISPTQDFVYLGTLLHFTLRDFYDINRRIKKSNQMMGALQFYWRRSEVELWAKVSIYKACVLTTLLWGAETWAFTTTTEKRLETFHHRSICIILGISMRQVEQERITNDDVRKRFQNIESIHDII